MFGYKWTRNVQFTLLCLAFALIFMLPQWIRERSLAMKLGLAAALVAAFFMLAGMAQANGGGGESCFTEANFRVALAENKHGAEAFTAHDAAEVAVYADFYNSQPPATSFNYDLVVGIIYPGINIFELWLRNEDGCMHFIQISPNEALQLYERARGQKS